MSLTPLSQTTQIQRVDAGTAVSKVWEWIGYTANRLWSLDTRALEMAVGMSIGLRGFLLLVYPQAMDNPLYNSLSEIMGATGWMLLCFLASFLQIGGVIINGHWSKSPWMRFTGAMIAATFFAMVSTLYISSVPPISLTASILIPLAIANFWTALNIASKT